MCVQLGVGDYVTAQQGDRCAHGFGHMRQQEDKHTAASFVKIRVETLFSFCLEFL